MFHFLLELLLYEKKDHTSYPLFCSGQASCILQYRGLDLKTEETKKLNCKTQMRCVSRCFCSTEDIPDIPSNFRIPCHNPHTHTHTHTHTFIHTHTHTHTHKHLILHLAHDAIFFHTIATLVTVDKDDKPVNSLAVNASFQSG